MDTRPASGSFPERHYHRDLPRQWITLPRPVQRAAMVDPLLRGLFPSHVGYFPRAGRHSVQRDPGIDSSIFNYCVNGRGWCVVAGGHHEVHSGDLMVVPAGEPHRYGTDPQAPWTLHWCHAMGEQLPLLIERLGVSSRSPVAHLGRSAELEALFTEMRVALEDDYAELSLLYAAQTLAHLMGWMIRLREHHAPEPDACTRTRATLGHMKRHLASPLSVDELAALADLSVSHYSELVRRMTGYPPKDYLTRLRVHRAAQLLDTTEMHVQAIAREVGYADPLHFSRVFRRINEQSPRDYRARRPRMVR
jgi:AraC family transcriptional regulator, arabinose operon regulatory protein